MICCYNTSCVLLIDVAIKLGWLLVMSEENTYQIIDSLADKDRIKLLTLNVLSQTFVSEYISLFICLGVERFGKVKRLAVCSHR